MSVTAFSASTEFAVNVIAAPETTCVTGNTTESELKTWNGPTPLLIVTTAGVPEYVQRAWADNQCWYRCRGKRVFAPPPPQPAISASTDSKATVASDLIDVFIEITFDPFWL